MKKKIFVLGALVLISIQLFSQEDKLVPFKKFGAVMSLYTDIWFNTPDGVDQRTINQGFSGYVLYNHQLSTGVAYISIGAGVGSHNLHSNALIRANDDGITEMVIFDTAYSNLNYEKNKFSVSYFDFPIEILVRAKNEMRFAVGIKPGFNIDSHTKYRGDNFPDNSRDEIKFKTKKLGNVESWRYQISAKVGWRNIGIQAAYSFTGVFAKDKGPDLIPLSIGIYLTSF